MKHTYKSGVVLTQDRIEEIIDSIPKDRLDDVMNAWNELTPFICLCWRQILGYIISAFPEAAYITTESMVDKLLKGPDKTRWMPERDASRALMKLRNVSGEFVVNKLYLIMLREVNCPDLYKETDDWLAVLAMHEILTETPVTETAELPVVVDRWITQHTGRNR